MKAPYIPAFFKMEIIPESVPADGRVEILGGVLGGAGAQSVEAQGILVVFSVLPVFAAGVHLTEHQLPVITLLLLVIVYRAASAEILYLHAQVLIAGDDDGIAVALPGLIDGVGEDLKNRVLAALQIVRAKNNRRTLPHPVLTLQHGNAGVAVLFLLFFCHN